MGYAVVTIIPNLSGSTQQGLFLVTFHVDCVFGHCGGGLFILDTQESRLLKESVFIYLINFAGKGNVVRCSLLTLPPGSDTNYFAHISLDKIDHMVMPNFHVPGRPIKMFVNSLVDYSYQLYSYQKNSFNVAS